MMLSKMSTHDKIKFVILGLVALYFVVFLLFNLEESQVHFLFMKIRLPVVVLILFSAMLGAGLMWGVLTFKGGRRKGDEAKS